jgi:hypothetical protein
VLVLKGKIDDGLVLKGKLDDGLCLKSCMQYYGNRRIVFKFKIRVTKPWHKILDLE